MNVYKFSSKTFFSPLQHLCIDFICMQRCIMMRNNVLNHVYEYYISMQAADLLDFLSSHSLAHSLSPFFDTRIFFIALNISKMTPLFSLSFVPSIVFFIMMLVCLSLTGSFIFWRGRHGGNAGEEIKDINPFF